METNQATGKVPAVAAPPPSMNVGLQHSGFEPLLHVEEAAKLLGGMHPKTLMRFARAGEVPAVKLGRFWFFRASSLNRWIELSSNEPSVPCQKEFSR